MTSIVPTIDFIIDKQMKEKIVLENGENIGGIIEYSLGIHWLKFSFYVVIEIKK